MCVCVCAPSARSYCCHLRVMQSSSNGLSTLVVFSVYVNKKYICIKIPPLTLIDGSSAVRYPIRMNTDGFRSQMEASHVSSHTDEL